MYYFDNFKHLYINLNENIAFPSISLIEFNLEEVYKIYEILLKYFPSFTKDFKIYNKEYLVGQKKYFCFIKIFESDFSIFAEELRILVSYAGGAKKEEILNSPQQNYSPSFLTNKIYYHLFIYLIQNYKEENAIILNLEPFSIPFIKNYKISYKDISIEPWTVNLFDEIDLNELISIIMSKIPYEWSAKFWKNPFSIERATLAMNLISIEQTKFLYKDFINFIFNLENEIFESENFQKYFKEWEVTTCFSKNGNTHWKFLKIPFINL